MPNFRRNYVPGGTYFYTLVTDQRAPFLCEERARRLLRGIIKECRARWPFRIDAIVLLPEHLHAMFTLPVGDDRYSRRWAWMKKEFTGRWLDVGGAEQPISEGRRRDGRRGVLQPKYWEHTIRDEDDHERHFDYIHFNPVRHGLVRCPRDWPYSSFRRYVRMGVYPEDWGCASIVENDRRFRFEDLDTTAME